MLDDITVWIIIIGFYAPLHFMLPMLILFITGSESETLRRTLMRRALIDSALSMAAAFLIAIWLARVGLMIWAMLVLLVSMPAPFIRIIQHRREITG